MKFGSGPAAAILGTLAAATRQSSAKQGRGTWEDEGLESVGNQCNWEIKIGRFSHYCSGVALGWPACALNLYQHRKCKQAHDDSMNPGKYTILYCTFFYM